MCSSISENARTLNDLPIVVVENVFEQLRQLMDVADYTNIIVTSRLWGKICNNDQFINHKFYSSVVEDSRKRVQFEQHSALSLQRSETVSRTSSATTYEHASG